MQVCTSLQTDNHASTPPLSFLQAGCPFCRPSNNIKALKVRGICNVVEWSKCLCISHDDICCLSRPQFCYLLVCAVQIILAFGNYVNSAKRGSAYGFKLQSLDMVLCICVISALCMIISVIHCRFCFSRSYFAFQISFHSAYLHLGLLAGFVLPMYRSGGELLFKKEKFRVQDAVTKLGLYSEPVIAIHDNVLMFSLLCISADSLSTHTHSHVSVVVITLLSGIARFRCIHF